MWQAKQQGGAQQTGVSGSGRKGPILKPPKTLARGASNSERTGEEMPPSQDQVVTGKRQGKSGEETKKPARRQDPRKAPPVKPSRKKNNT